MRFLSGVGLGLFYTERGKVLFFLVDFRVRNISEAKDNSGKLVGDTLSFPL